MGTGTYFGPIGMPDSFLYWDEAAIAKYFVHAEALDPTMAVLVRWDQTGGLATLTERLIVQARDLDFDIHYHIDPLKGWSHDAPSPPTYLGNSFTRGTVRAAFKKRCLAAAAMRPKVLGIGTEVNLLAGDPVEFDAYVSLARETYRAIKLRYPDQIVTISFAWDVMRLQGQYGLLKKFERACDVYGFTSYPNILGPQSLDDFTPSYYGDIRRYLPNQRVAISELGFSSFNHGEEEQAQFIEELPALLPGVHPEWLTWFHLYDWPTPMPDPRFNHLGLRHADGSEKLGWPAAVLLSI